MTAIQTPLGIEVNVEFTTRPDGIVVLHVEDDHYHDTVTRTMPSHGDEQVIADNITAVLAEFDRRYAADGWHISPPPGDGAHRQHRFPPG